MSFLYRPCTRCGQSFHYRVTAKHQAECLLAREDDAQSLDEDDAQSLDEEAEAEVENWDDDHDDNGEDDDNRGYVLRIFPPRKILVPVRNDLPVDALRAVQYDALMRDINVDPRAAYGIVDWALMRTVHKCDMSGDVLSKLCAGLQSITSLNDKSSYRDRVQSKLDKQGLRFKPHILSFWNGDLKDPEGRWTHPAFLVDPVALVSARFGEDVWSIKEVVWSNYAEATSGTWYQSEIADLQYDRDGDDGGPTLLITWDWLLDKTLQSGKSLYPGYLLSNHLTAEERMGLDHTHPFMLIEPFAPPRSVTPFPKAQIKRAAHAHAKALQEAALRPLEAVAYGKRMADLAGTEHTVAHQLQCTDMDHPEAVVQACVLNNRCEICCAVRDEFLNPDHDSWAPRNAQTACDLVVAAEEAKCGLKTATTPAAKAACTRAFKTAKDELHAAGYHNEQNFWWNFPGPGAYNNHGFAELHNFKMCMKDIMQGTLDVIRENAGDQWPQVLFAMDRVAVDWFANCKWISGECRTKGFSGILLKKQQNEMAAWKVNEHVKMKDISNGFLILRAVTSNMLIEMGRADVAEVVTSFVIYMHKANFARPTDETLEEADSLLVSMVDKAVLAFPSINFKRNLWHNLFHKGDITKFHGMRHSEAPGEMKHRSVCAAERASNNRATLKQNAEQLEDDEAFRQWETQVKTTDRIMSWTAANGHTDKLKSLLEHLPADIDLDSDVMSPLAAACKHNQRACARLLLAKGANPQGAGRRWAPPLLVAAQYGRAEIARLLLAQAEQAPAKKMLTAKWRGLTAIQWATSRRHEAVLELLQTRARELSVRFSTDRTGPDSADSADSGSDSDSDKELDDPETRRKQHRSLARGSTAFRYVNVGTPLDPTLPPELAHVEPCMRKLFPALVSQLRDRTPAFGEAQRLQVFPRMKIRAQETGIEVIKCSMFSHPEATPHFANVRYRIADGTILEAFAEILIFYRVNLPGANEVLDPYDLSFIRWMARVEGTGDDEMNLAQYIYCPNTVRGSELGGPWYEVVQIEHITHRVMLGPLLTATGDQARYKGRQLPVARRVEGVPLFVENSDMYLNVASG